MSFNGSGTFLINTAGQPVVSGTVISSTAFNALTADLATGLSTAITKDGQTTVTANIPMSTYKFTGLGVGSAATDSANLSQVQSTVTKLLTSVSGTDTITAVGAPVVAAYAAGQMFYFVATGDNTGAVTLNIDSLGAKAVTRDGSVALAAGDIKSGEVVVVVYDGTRFQVVSQLNSAGDARFANVSIASSLYVGGVSTFVGNAGFSANVSIASALSVGGVAAITGATTIGGNLTLNGGTANGVLYLNGSKVATSGAAFGFDGTNLTLPAEGYRPSATSFLRLSGGDGAGSGANLLVFGQSHATAPGRAVLTATGTGYLELNTNGGSARLDSSGNLGLGVTPSAWGGGFTAFQVSGGYGGLAANGNADTRLYAGGYFGSSNDTYAVSGLAVSMYKQLGGAHSWHTAPSGTAGNAISFTQAMTLDASGNLGVGTTSPTAVAGYKVVETQGSSGGIFQTSASGNTVKTRLYSTPTDGFVGTNSNHAFGFITNDTERARITSGGYFKASNDGTYVGVADATHEFRQTANNNAVVTSATNASFTSTLYRGLVSKAAGTTFDFAYWTANNVLQFQVRGDGNAYNVNGTYGTISDQRLKQDIADAPSQWNDIKAVRFRKYRMKDDVARNENAPYLLGVVAQELEQVSPGLVDDGEVKTVKSSILLMKAAVALQEAMTRIEQLEAKVAAWESK